MLLSELPFGKVDSHNGEWGHTTGLMRAPNAAWVVVYRPLPWGDDDGTITICSSRGTWDDLHPLAAQAVLYELFA